MTGYFDDLAKRLRDGGVPADRVRATVDDLAAYAEESGTDPETEFGPVVDFTAQLAAAEGRAGGGEDPDTDPAATTWRWTADIFVDQQRLNEFGAQGWEVDHVDHVGMFVSHRDPHQPQQWEYRREIVTPGGRQALLERLAPEGWEPCGRWLPYQYLKRPKAASVGPAAAISAPPEAPRRHNFLSWRYYLLVAAVVLAVIWRQVDGWDPSSGFGFVVGALVGVVGGAALAAAGLYLAQKRARRHDRGV